jgi:hypothetical protein
VIKVVVFELYLVRFPSQAYLVLDESLVISVPPFFINILFVKIVSNFRWNEGRFESLLLQVVPLKISQPGMPFYFLYSTSSKTVLGFALDHLVYEVSCCSGPTRRNIRLPNLNLLLQDVVSDLFPRLTNVGSLTSKSSGLKDN